MQRAACTELLFAHVQGCCASRIYSPGRFPSCKSNLCHSTACRLSAACTSTASPVQSRDLACDQKSSKSLKELIPLQLLKLDLMVPEELTLLPCQGAHFASQTPINGPSGSGQRRSRGGRCCLCLDRLHSTAPSATRRGFCPAQRGRRCPPVQRTTGGSQN